MKIKNQKVGNIKENLLVKNRLDINKDIWYGNYFN